MIDGHYHADGGITTNLLAGDLVFYRDLARELGVHRTAGRVTVRLWVIVNMTLGPGPEVVDVDDALAISARAMILLFKLNQQQTLMRFWEICEAVNAGVEGLAIEMHYTAIPDAWNDEPGAMELFNEAYMNRLQDFGNELAKSANPWATLAARSVLAGVFPRVPTSSGPCGAGGEGGERAARPVRARRRRAVLRA